MNKIIKNLLSLCIVFIYLFFGVKTIYATEDNFLEYSTHQLTRIYI